MSKLAPVVQEILDGMLERRPELEGCVESLLAFHDTLWKCYDAGGKLLICGNGGSSADAMHIAGELDKSFERIRPIPRALANRLKGLPFGDDLRKHLEAGLPAIPLGCNAALKTAIENDSELRDIAFAQEMLSLGNKGDVLLAISTSGNADNCLMALAVARAIGATGAALTGPHGGEMASFAEIAIRAPGQCTKTVQESHVVLYHTLCAMVEAHYFPKPR